MRSVSEVGGQAPCHRLSLISLRCSIIVYITVMPGGLHMRVHPPGKAPDLLCPRIQQNRMAQPSWKQDLGRGHQLGRLLHSTQKGQCQRNMIIQKCGMKPLQRRGAEQSGQVREGAEGLTAEWAESLSVAWRALYSHWDAGGTRHGGRIVCKLETSQEVGQPPQERSPFHPAKWWTARLALQREN